jgi:hypothetical protein
VASRRDVDDGRLFFVTGMHRSGTSALARILNLLGVSLGPEDGLMTPQPDNPTGFWESRAVARFNERLLEAVGGSWDRPPTITPDWAALPDLDERRRAIVALLASVRSDAAGCHAVKDPRLAITLPLWRQVAPPERVIVTIREPLAVCQSLHRRNGIPFERGAELWLRYVRGAIDDHELPTVIVDYADLVTRPRDVIRNLAGVLDLSEPDGAVFSAIEEFLDPSLNHAARDGGVGGPVLDRARAYFAALRTMPVSTDEPGGARIVDRDAAGRGVAPLVESDTDRSREEDNIPMDVTAPQVQTVTHPLQDVHEYLKGRFAQVEGWCVPQLWQSIQPIDEIQRRNRIGGPIAEIGVYQGKFFIGLLKTKQQANNYAIDVFSMQRFNLDGAGVGNQEALKSNITLSGSSVEDVHFLEADSMALTSSDLQEIRATSGGFSMFSVDGCHTVEHTINDVRIAMELTRPGGVIFVDDYYNASWPGVQEGICKLYLTDSPRFVPLIATCNKLILCHISYHAEYLSYVRDFFKANFDGTRVKPVKRFGYDTLTIVPNLQTGAFLAL